MERKIKEKWGWKRAVAIMVAFSAILNGIPEVAALDTRGDPAKKTVLTYEEQNEKYQVKEFTLTEQAKAQWDDSFRSFNEWTVEQGYDRAEEAFNENGMVYVNEETDNEEIPLFSEAVNDVEEMPKTVALTTYAGDGDSHYIWRLCKAVAVDGEETQAITETGEAATEITEAEVETASELEETFDNKEAETEAVTQYFWVRTKEKIDLESYNEDDTQEKVEGEPEEIIDNPEEQPEAAEDNVVEEPLEESDSNARSTLTDVRASADVIVTSWAQLKSAVESTPAYGSKTIGIGTSFSSTRDVIHFGANAGVNIKVVNMGNYVINCSTRADTDAVATEGGAIRVKNGATVTFENLKFDGGMTSSIESAARSNSAALHNGTNLSGASTNFAFIGIQSGSLDIVGDQSAMYNFRFTYDNRACLIATGCFNSSSSAVLNIRQGRFYNNWGIDGSLVLTQGQRAVTNVYGGEYDHNFVRDEGLFDVYDLYHGALNFYGGTIHDNYGTAWDGTLSSTVAICDLRTAQGLAQGSIRLYFRGSGNGNSGIRVYNNYHLRNSGNAFVTLGSGQELASNMGLIWNWEATTGAKIKENSQHAVLFDMTPEDHLQIGPTTFIKNTTGHYSPDGQISLAMGAGMSGAPYGYFSDTNSEDGIADGMYLDYDYSTNSAMLGGKRYGLYEGDLPSGVSPVYYNGKTINKMLYLTDRTADITYNLYVKSGNNVTQLTSLNGTRYPMTKRIGLPADYRVAITAPVDSSGRYVATEYKWGDEGSTNALTNGSTPKKTLSNGQPYTINIYYKDSTVPDPAKYTVSASVSGGNGSVAPASQSVTAGGSASVTFTPNNGYRINTVTDNGANVTGQVVNNRYTINNVQANHNIVATYRSITPAGEGSFKIKKVDANTKTPLAGATFYVTSGQIGLPYDQTVTTNSQGLIELTKDFQDTITGEIYIEEKTAPTGYEKASGKWTVRVENGTAVSVSYSNPSDPVYGTVTKGSDGYWVFPNKRTVQQYAVTAQVSGGHGSVAPASQIVTAGNNASVTFTPDNGYRISSVTDNGINVTNQVTNNRYSVNNVQGNHSIVVTYATTGEGSFKIKKVDANSKVPLAGASFLVTSDSVDLPYKQTVTTNSQGLAEVTNGFKPTATGELYIWEQTAPSGYEKPTGQWTVKVENGTAVSVKYSNPADSVYGTVTKGNDGYWIFQNKKTVQQYTVTAQVSGGHGSVAPESQSVTEGSSASVAFTPDNGYIIGSVTDNGTNVTNQVKNNRYSISNVQGNHSIVVTYIATGEGSFKIKKVDANSKTPLAGASFWVTSDSVDLPYGQTVTTNSQGLAEITKDFKTTATGTLVLKEQTAPTGYEKPAGEWTVKVENGTAVSVSYSNPSDSVYGTVTKGSDGYWIFQNKKIAQQYTVTAQVSGGHGSVAPESQTVTEGNSASVTFTPEKGYQIYTVTDNGTNVTSQVANNRYTINNVQANHSIVVTYSSIGEDEFRIKKVDAQNGNALQGAEFYSTSSSVTLPHEKSVVTNTSGIAILPFHLANAQGTFVLEERTAPNGYEKPSGKWTVKVENGTATSVTYSDNSDNTYKVTKDSDGYWVFKNKKEVKQYKVIASVSGGNGTVEPEAQNVPEGENAAIIFKPNAGYQIETVTDNGKDVTDDVSESQYVISNVQNDHTVVVTYSHKVECPYTLDLNTGELTDKNGTLLASPTQPATGYLYNSSRIGIDGSVFNTCTADGTHNHNLIVKGSDSERLLDIRNNRIRYDLTMQGVSAKYAMIGVQGALLFEGDNKFGGEKLNIPALNISADSYALGNGAKVTAYTDNETLEAIKIASESLKMLDLTMKDTLNESIVLKIADDDRALPANMKRIAVLDNKNGTWLTGDIQVQTEDGSKSYVRGDDSAPDGNYSDNNRYGTIFPLSGTDKDSTGIGRYKQVRLEEEEPVEICPLTFDESTGKLTDKNGDEITEGITIENGEVTFTDDIFKSCTIGLDQHTDGAHYLIVKQYIVPKYLYDFSIILPYIFEEQPTMTYGMRNRASSRISPENGDLLLEAGRMEINSPNGIYLVSNRRVYCATKESGPRLIINQLAEIRYKTENDIIAGQSSDADTAPIEDNVGLVKCLDITFKDSPTDQNMHINVAAGKEVEGGVTKKVTVYGEYNKRIQVIDKLQSDADWLAGDITITNQDAANLNKAYIRGTGIGFSDLGYSDDNYSFFNEFGTTFPLAGVRGDLDLPAGRYGRYKDVRFQNQVKLLNVSIPINAIDFMVERRGTGRTDKGLRSGEAEIENNSMYCWDLYTDPDNSRIKTFGVQSSEVGVDYMGITLNETKHVGYKLKNYANVSDKVMNTPVTGQPIVCLDAVAGSKRIPLDEETPVSTGTPWFTLPAATTSDTNTSWDNADITAPGVAKIKLEVPEGYTDAKPYCQASDKLDSKNNIALTASHKLSYKLTFKEPKNQWPMQ